MCSKLSEKPIESVLCAGESNGGVEVKSRVDETADDQLRHHLAGAHCKPHGRARSVPLECVLKLAAEREDLIGVAVRQLPGLGELELTSTAVEEGVP